MLQDKHKILILSAPIGSGHKLAAKALDEAFSKYDECEVVQASVFDFFPKIIGNVFLKSYLFMLKFSPSAYAVAYKWGNSPSGSLWLRNMINCLLAKLANSFLKKADPDVVIATHATPAGVIDIYKKTHPDIFLASVITDFTVHKWWLCDRTDAYFLAAEDIEPPLEMKKGQKAFYYGIPVRKEFRQEYSKDYLRMKFGWGKNERVCLLMGGGDGILPMEDLITAVVNNYDATMKFVAVTGKNVSLARQLRKLPFAVKVFGFIDPVADLMNSADYLITKAGGLTAAEALTTRVKYIIYNPLPGQEAANAKYLEHMGAAKIGYTPFEVARAVREYDRADNIFLGAMGKPLAADYIVEAILREID